MYVAQACMLLKRACMSEQALQANKVSAANNLLPYANLAAYPKQSQCLLSPNSNVCLSKRCNMLEQAQASYVCQGT